MRFRTYVPHYWNASEFGRSFGVADTTVRNYLDVLTAALVIRQLPPWHASISKRQVRSPKVYFLDSGLLHTLLSLTDRDDVERHPKVGASWVRIPAHPGRRFRSMPVTRSGNGRPPLPAQAGHLGACSDAG